MEPRPDTKRPKLPFYVRDTEEGWGVFRSDDDKPVAGPSLDWGVIVRLCDTRNRIALSLRPEDV